MKNGAWKEVVSLGNLVKKKKTKKLVMAIYRMGMKEGIHRFKRLGGVVKTRVNPFLLRNKAGMFT